MSETSEISDYLHLSKSVDVCYVLDMTVTKFSTL